MQTNDSILFGDVKCSFRPEVQWDLGYITADCAEWVRQERLKPESNSRAWLFSSHKTEILLSTFVGFSLSKALRVLVETSSILYNWGLDTSYSQYSPSDLWRIRSFAGSQVVHDLGNALKNARLANASQDELKALFLVLLGTIIAVGYSNSVFDSEEVNWSAGPHRRSS